MRLSSLQRYIILECFPVRGKIGRAIFTEFYKGIEKKSKDIVDTITKTLERLIDNGLMVGYGLRTPKKWFIKEVRLTPLGRRIAKKLQGEQQILPFKT